MDALSLVFTPVVAARETKTRDPPRPASFRDDGSLYLREHCGCKRPYSSRGGVSCRSAQVAAVPPVITFVTCEATFVSRQTAFGSCQATFVLCGAAFASRHATFACHRVSSTANLATFVSCFVAFASGSAAFVSSIASLHSRGAPCALRFSRAASRGIACAVGSGVDGSRCGSRSLPMRHPRARRCRFSVPHWDVRLREWNVRVVMWNVCLFFETHTAPARSRSARATPR